MLMVALGHMMGLEITMEDIFYIYKMKRSQVPHKWYLSPRSRMNGFIIGAPTTNKDVEQGVVVVSSRQAFGTLELIRPLIVPCCHSSPGLFLIFVPLLHCIFW